MTEATLRRHWATLSRLGGHCTDWEGEGRPGPHKKQYASSAKSLCKWLRDCVLECDGAVRFNPGGCAVSGEVTLHTDHVYIQFSGDLHNQLGVLIRTCKGRKDYCGGPNQWINSTVSVAELARRVLAVQQQAKQAA